MLDRGAPGLTAFVNACRPWEFDQETAGQGRGYRRKLKGHKHDKLAAARFVSAAMHTSALPDHLTSPVLKHCVRQAGRHQEEPRGYGCTHSGLPGKNMLYCSPDCFLGLLAKPPGTREFVKQTCLSQESRKLKEASILDQLLMTPKQRRFKQLRETK